MANTRITDDPRIDPRIKAMLGGDGLRQRCRRRPEDRQQLLDEATTPEAMAVRDLVTMFLGMCDNEEVAPSKGLAITEHTLVSAPDANTMHIRFIRPDNEDVVPCVYYIHGGGMATMSCDDGNYRAWGRIIATQGVAVAMVDFRNALLPSSASRSHRFPPGSTTACRESGGWPPTTAGCRRPESHRRGRGERRRQPHDRHRAPPGA